MNQIVANFICAIGGLGIAEIFIILLIILGVCVFPIIALIHVITGTFKEKSDKLIWVILILFLPFLGPLMYFLIGKKSRIVQ